MSVEPRQALYAHLRGDPGVQAAVGDSVYQGRVPKEKPDGTPVTKPLIVIWPAISRVRERELADIPRSRTRLQVTIMADTQPAAEKAARAVVAAVDGFRGLMAGAVSVLLATVDLESQVYEDGANEYWHHIDILIRREES